MLGKYKSWRIIYDQVRSTNTTHNNLNRLLVAALLDCDTWTLSIKVGIRYRAILTKFSAFTDLWLNYLDILEVLPTLRKMETQVTEYQFSLYIVDAKITFI